MRYLKQFEVQELPDGSEITVAGPGNTGTRELVLRHVEDYPWPIAVDRNGLFDCELVWCDTTTRVMLTTDARKLEEARKEARR